MYTAYKRIHTLSTLFSFLNITADQTSVPAIAGQLFFHFESSFQNVAMWRFLQFVVYASLILDRLTFHASKDFSSMIPPDKVTKQSCDLKCVYVFIHNTLT